MLVLSFNCELINMRLRPVSIALSLLFALPVCAQTEIRAVTLSTAGLVLVEANGAFDGSDLRLNVRRDHIDDFLKSLRVVDPVAGVPQLSLSGPGGLEDVFASLPFGPDALGDLRVLVDAMTGAPVELERRGVALAGRLMGTRDQACSEAGPSPCVALAVQTRDGGVSQVLLDEGTSLRFVDEADREALERGLAALRASATARQLAVRITSSDPTPRDLVLGWLQPAPQWKTAWRVEDGPDGLMLTGWAVLENATGQDWNKVELTLATGAVQALQAQLYDRTPVARKLAAPVARMTASAMPAPMAMMELAADSAFSVMPVSMDDGDSFSRFTLSTPVTLAAGDMISLPFLNERLTDARLTLYRGGSGAVHPMIALNVENPLPLRLPSGVLTLFETGRGHAGDAMMPELAPGAREVVEFAQDTAVRVDERADVEQRQHSMRVLDGILISENWLERTITYRIQGAEDRPRQLTIAHPAHPGWTLQTPGGEEGLNEVRFSVEVPAGGITEFPVLESRLHERHAALLDLDVPQLVYWQGQANDDRLRGLFESLQALRAEESELKARLLRLREAETQLVADQQRLVGLIVQLGDDSAATRQRRARVDTIETEIEAGRQAIQEAESRLERVGQTLRDTILQH